ncbi:MAG: oligosaccharide flippase family protein, partial [Oscillospiraceae bacterium]|nr:oligosaccharide flippase family protein [Oscillospiraceae bacterium]
MKQNNMVTGALILSAAAIFVRIIGFVFRIYLSNAMGAEGMGVYMLIISMYNFCVTLATSGMSVAVSTLTAEQLSLGKPANAKRVVRRAVTMAVIISSVVCGGVIIFANPIGTYILKDARTIVSLRILAVGIPFLAVSACLRGYFVASRRV